VCSVLLSAVLHGLSVDWNMKYIYLSFSLALAFYHSNSWTSTNTFNFNPKSQCSFQLSPPYYVCSPDQKLVTTVLNSFIYLLSSLVSSSGPHLLGLLPHSSDLLSESWTLHYCCPIRTFVYKGPDPGGAAFPQHFKFPKSFWLKTKKGILFCFVYLICLSLRQI
jgi:hypothetical protein